MVLFDNINLEGFLLILQDFKTILEVLRKITSNANLQYFLMILLGQALHQFDTLCAHVESTTISHLNLVILVLGAYFPL